MLQAFKALGENLHEHVDLRRVGPAAYRVHFEGSDDEAFSHLDLLNDVVAMRAQLDTVEPGAGGRCQHSHQHIAASAAGLNSGVPTGKSALHSLLSNQPLL